MEGHFKSILRLYVPDTVCCSSGRAQSLPTSGLKQALNMNLELNPLTALFGLLPAKNLPPSTEHVVAFSTLLARRILRFKWKHTQLLDTQHFKMHIDNGWIDG